MAKRPRILFLDIDGVLATPRSRILPQNRAIREKEAGGRLTPQERREALLGETFDPCAIALVNRICAVTGARLVIHSNWRRTVGAADTHAKLVEQGIPAENFHPNPVCPMWPSSEKGQDIHAWLDDNRTTRRPEPSKWVREHPYSQSRAAQRSRAAYRSRLMNYGIDCAIVDDELFGLWECGLPHVRTNFYEGLGVKEYRVICAVLGGVDPEMGVQQVSAADGERVLAAFEGDRVAAMAWLHGERVGSSRASRLDLKQQAAMERSLSVLGYGGESAHSLRQSVLDELAVVEAERDADVAARESLRNRPLVADF